MQNILYSWKFSSEKQRGSMWYIIALSIIIWIVLWWFLSRQYILSFLVILIAWVYFFIENNSEDTVNVSITQLWIQINSTFYDYSKIASYTFLYHESEPILLRLNLIQRGIKRIDLKVNNEITLPLKEILPNSIKEDTKGEISFADRLIQFLKL